MGDMLKQGLELKQTQKLSPLQIQTIKLIELPVQELEQRIRKELEENMSWMKMWRKREKMMTRRDLARSPCLTIRRMTRSRATS